MHHVDKEHQELDLKRKPPTWYKSEMDSLSLARSRILITKERLAQAQSREIPEFFSNSVLHQQVNKQQECHNVLLKLDVLQEKIIKIIEQNEWHYNKQECEFSVKNTEINDYKKNVIEILARYTEQHNEKLYQLRGKNVDELLCMVSLIQDDDLVHQANMMKAKNKNYQKQMNDFYRAPATWVQFFDKKEFNKLEIEAKKLADEYFSAAEQLEKSSSISFEEIYNARTNLLENTKKTVQKLQQAHSEFCQLTETDDSIPNIRIKVKKYNDFDNAYHAAKTIIGETYSYECQIIKQYQKMGQDYGVYRTDQLEGFQKELTEMRKKLDIVIRSATIAVKNTGDRMEHRKLALAKWDLLLLLREVTVCNATFWNNQVSCLGSCFYINKVSVPAGVAQIAVLIRNKMRNTTHIDVNEFDADSIFLEIKNIVSLRKKAGTGFFAKRAQNTTDEFYNFISKMDLRYFTEESLRQVKKSFANIKDDKGRCLLNREASERLDIAEMSQINKLMPELA